MEDQTFEIIESAILKDGRSKGGLPALNKRTDGFSRTDVVNAFQDAFRMIGGVPRMALWANANPDKFYPLYSKLLPSTAINIGDNAQVIIQHAIPPGALDVHPDSTTSENHT
jgi:hypothetical protein